MPNISITNSFETLNFASELGNLDMTNIIRINNDTAVVLEENHHNLLQKIGIGLGLIFGILIALFTLYQIALKCINLLIIRLLTRSDEPKIKVTKRNRRNKEETLELDQRNEESEKIQLWVS